MTLVIPNADTFLINILKSINEKIENPYELVNSEEYCLSKEDEIKFNNILKRYEANKLKFYNYDEMKERLLKNVNIVF